MLDREFICEQNASDAYQELKSTGLTDVEIDAMRRPVSIPAMAGYKFEASSYLNWYRVISPAGAVYAVNLIQPSCSCPDQRTRGSRRVCKHISALRQFLSQAAIAEAQQR